jgi:uncharacterized integral membrane protein (TIGR00698 family)
VYTLAIFALLSILSGVSIVISDLPAVSGAGISPLIVALLLGLLCGNTFRPRLPAECDQSILFAAKAVLRIAIVLYGFQITVWQIMDVGLAGLTASLIMVTSTLVGGAYIGSRWFGLDRDLSILNAVGSAVCGAAAVIAAETVLRSEPHKGVVAVSTVVVFGTISIFVFPLIYTVGKGHLNTAEFGIYIGSSIHEVAQAVAVGNAIGAEAAGNSVIVKMTRVILLAPVLVAIGLWARYRLSDSQVQQSRLVVPWFAFGFIIVIGIHSTGMVSDNVVTVFNKIDTFLLTVAMIALGFESNLAKIKAVGIRPVYHALVMFVWLLIGGYWISAWASDIFPIPWTTNQSIGEALN